MKKWKKQKIGIIIPTYNESENIISIIPLISKAIADLNISRNNGYNYEIYVIDDNSPDKTSDKAKALCNKYPITVIVRSEKKGYGEASKVGFHTALQTCDLIITIDCDLSHDPKEIPNLVKKIEEGYDLVIGSRYVDGGSIKNWPFIRRVMSKFANIITVLFLGLPVKDCTSGYRCYKKNVLEEVGLLTIMSDGYSFLEELLFNTSQKNFKICEIPICFVERIHGKSKLSKKEMFKFIVTIICLKIRNN